MTSARRGLFYKGLLDGIILTLLLAVYAGAGIYSFYTSRGPLKKITQVEIKEGMSTTSIAALLEKNNVIQHPSFFKLFLRLLREDDDLKYGLYTFCPGVSLKDVISELLAGNVSLETIFIPEGLTNKQIIELLGSYGFLDDDLEEFPHEGLLFPDTYWVAKGTSYSTLFQVMQDKMVTTLQELLETPPEAHPLKKAGEILILASIVEKEAACDAEKPLIAGVFLNRLKRGMRLQSDPTAVYGITSGHGKLKRKLYRKDLLHESDHNTYRIKGLPPTPIANPGRSSIQAVLNPKETDYLYFVADNKGRHLFAKTLKEHNRNIQKIRQKKRQFRKRSVLQRNNLK